MTHLTQGCRTNPVFRSSRVKLSWGNPILKGDRSDKRVVSQDNSIMTQHWDNGILCPFIFNWKRSLARGSTCYGFMIKAYSGPQGKSVKSTFLVLTDATYNNSETANLFCHNVFHDRIKKRNVTVAPIQGDIDSR